MEYLFPGINKNLNIREAISEYIKNGHRTIKFDGFSSCSVYRESKYPKSVNLEINVPKGTPGAYINSLSMAKTEYEFLLSDTVKYEIVGTRFDSKTRLDYIILEALI